MPEQPSDATLIAQAKRGSLDAFNGLVLRYQDYIYTVTYRIMSSQEAANDATQETFLAAYTKLAQFRGGNFKAWLARIATNTCYDIIRKQKRRPADYLEELPGSDFYDEPPVASEVPAPEDEAVRNDLNQALQQCISGLNDDQRSALVFIDVQGMSYQEVADMLQASLGTIKSRLSRARRAMRDCLQGFGELLPEEFRY